MLVGRVERKDIVTAVDLTMDGLLVLADRLSVTNDFPVALAIGNNIFHLDLRAQVWAAVTEKLTEQGIIDATGEIHPEIVDMIYTATRAERTLEGRWFHTADEGHMIRFAICRRDSEHLIMVRGGNRGEKIVLQRISSRVGLAGMVQTIIGDVKPAPMMTSVMGRAEDIQNAETPDDLYQFGADARSASTLLKAIQNPDSWVELVVTERLEGGTVSRPEVAAGVLDSPTGRVVSVPKSINNTLYASFTGGSPDNLARALAELTTFLPSGTWMPSTPLPDNHDDDSDDYR
ncbi:ESX-1 secretion-associated protein EspG1 (plasmid) [Mycobacterium sp. THAF192]|nr:ESX-1 secretion-associated protein EspG1 [Mycobacterium sp. THAF192]